MLITLRKQYKLFTNRLEESIKNLELKVQDLLINIDYSADMVTKIVEKYSIKFKLELIQSYKTNPRLYREKLSDYIEYAYPKSTYEKLMLDNLKAFYKDQSTLITLMRELDYLKSLQSRITEEIYKKAMRRLNFYIVSKVLTGDGYNFGKGLGSIYVTEKKEVSNSRINWNESNKLKEEIIKSGEIPYDKFNAPHGKKWFVYHTETYNYWWMWTKYGCVYPNRSLFSFTPTCFINTKERRKSDFLNNCESVQDIIESNLIGNMNKVNYLLAYDDKYHLKFRRNVQFN